MLDAADTYSKFAWIETLKKKDGKSVSGAFMKIIKSANKAPDLLHTDSGKEFLNKNFQKVLDEHNIQMYQTFSEKKRSIVERLNMRTNQKLKVQSLQLKLAQDFFFLDRFQFKYI